MEKPGHKKTKDMKHSKNDVRISGDNPEELAREILRETDNVLPKSIEIDIVLPKNK
jgi:hypothetical protein